MGAVGNFIFVAMAVNFGMILFALTMMIVYKIFLKDTSEDVPQFVLEEESIEEVTENMEEIAIEV
jgi:hypothetical protein